MNYKKEIREIASNQRLYEEHHLEEAIIHMMDKVGKDVLRSLIPVGTRECVRCLIGSVKIYVIKEMCDKCETTITNGG